jgi:hypothetical protein
MWFDQVLFLAPTGVATWNSSVTLAGGAAGYKPGTNPGTEIETSQALE